MSTNAYVMQALSDDFENKMKLLQHGTAKKILSRFLDKKVFVEGKTQTDPDNLLDNLKDQLKMSENLLEKYKQDRYLQKDEIKKLE